MQLLSEFDGSILKSNIVYINILMQTFGLDTQLHILYQVVFCLTPVSTVTSQGLFMFSSLN